MRKGPWPTPKWCPACKRASPKPRSCVTPAWRIPMTDEAGVSFHYEWSARYGQHSTIAITTAECDLLMKAGAEDELSDFLFPCG
jgi:hypothetical protein